MSESGAVVVYYLHCVASRRPTPSSSLPASSGSPSIKIYAITVMACYIRVLLQRVHGTAADLTPLDFQLMNSLLNVVEEYENDDAAGGMSLGIGVVEYSLRAAAVSALAGGCDLSKWWTVTLVSEWSKRKKCSLVPELAWKFLLVQEGVKLLQDREWLKDELQKWETSYSEK